jgi:hypothetical protein
VSFAPPSTFAILISPTPRSVATHGPIRATDHHTNPHTPQRADPRSDPATDHHTVGVMEV